MKKSSDTWSEEELEGINLHDKRLEDRAIKLLNRISSEPLSPINQACLNWAETKAAYRFFRNAAVEPHEILAPHIKNTVERGRKFKTILAIQDTAFFNYKTHPKTKDLGKFFQSSGLPRQEWRGLIMHTVFAVTPNGLPLGIIDQKIYAREKKPKKRPRQRGDRGKQQGGTLLPKESLKWIQGLINCNYHFEGSDCKTISVSDRESDIFELFEQAYLLKSSVLIRAKADRLVKGAMSPYYYRQNKQKLRRFMRKMKSRGIVTVNIPSRGGTLGNHHRSAELELRFAKVVIFPTQAKHSVKREPSELLVYAIYALEEHPPIGEVPIEWMLLTDIPVSTFDEAAEKIKWYSLRFRIETLHRILKSGFLVEQCRLGTAAALIRYLTLMSIASWRIYWITIVGRSNPKTPCTFFLTDSEWKVLYAKIYQTKNFPTQPITTQHAIHLIGRLGGFLDRKSDADPGVVSLWRGWGRLNDLVEGWCIASAA
jgi:hypothetical protein